MQRITAEDREQLAAALASNRKKGDPSAKMSERLSQTLRGGETYEAVLAALRAIYAEGRSHVQASQVARYVEANASTVGHVLSLLEEDGDLDCWSDSGKPTYVIREDGRGAP